jgi:phage terminase small subunit
MVVSELAKIGFANMADYMTVGTDGDPFLDFSKVTRDQAAALSEVTVEDFKDGRGEDARDVRRVKFKMHDKRAALVDLGKHLGLFTEDPEGKRGGDTYNIVMNMPAPAVGEDRSYRDGPVIEHDPKAE